MSEAFKIIENNEIQERNIASLATRPNMPSQYGVGNLDATALKSRFDDLAVLIIQRYNNLVRALSSEDALKDFKLDPKYFQIPTEEQTVDALLKYILYGNGKLKAHNPMENVTAPLDDVLSAMYASFAKVETNEDKREAAENGYTAESGEFVNGRVQNEKERQDNEKIRENNEAARKSVWIRYSEYPDGTDYTEEQRVGQEYIGVATSHNEPAGKGAYRWSRLNGKSAYEIACEYGFTGTESEFMDYLHDYTKQLLTTDGRALRVFVGTRAEYEALPNKADVFAIITDEHNAESLNALAEAVAGILDGTLAVPKASADEYGNNIAETYERNLDTKSGIEYVWVSKSDAYAVAGVTSGLEVVNIPSYFRGKPVIGIAQRAFEYSRSTLKRVRLPKGCQRLEPYAFYNCSKLEEIDLSAMADGGEIGEYAFCECVALERVYIPKGLTLGSNVFAKSRVDSELEIYCEEERPIALDTGLKYVPEGWHEDWNPNGFVVHWGTPRGDLRAVSAKVLQPGWRQIHPDFMIELQVGKSYAITCRGIAEGSTSYTAVVTLLDHTNPHRALVDNDYWSDAGVFRPSFIVVTPVTSNNADYRYYYKVKLVTACEDGTEMDRGSNYTLYIREL